MTIFPVYEFNMQLNCANLKKNTTSSMGEGRMKGMDE